MNDERPGYVIRDQSAMHFVTFTVVDWIPAFTESTISPVITASTLSLALFMNTRLWNITIQGYIASLYPLRVILCPALSSIGYIQ